jgi:glycine hydroxymethyltransferase
MTANFDAAKSAALAVTLLDWRDHGEAYGSAMVELAKVLASALDANDLPVYGKNFGYTQSHQFAVEAAPFGGGQAASKKLRKAGFLACGIGLPGKQVAGDMNGLRIGTPELVRWGVKPDHCDKLAALIARALKTNDPDSLASEVSAFRREFTKLHFVRD